jgi:hypothetical protein
MDRDSLTESTLIGPSFAPRLVITVGEGIGQKFVLRAETKIGRERDNHVVLSDPRVSRRHATVTYEAGNWTLTDLDSANGTLLNGVPIMAPQVLQEGDTISLGDTELVFQHAPGVAPQPVARPARRVAPAAPSQPRPIASPLSAVPVALPWIVLVVGGLLCVALAGGALILGPQLIRPGSKTPAAAEAQASPTPELVLVYQDDFSDPASGWDDAFDKYTMKQYGNQKYHIVIQTSNLMAWGLANRDISDFVMEVDTAQEEGPDNNGYGLLFRMQDRQNFYRYDISGDGFYLLSKFVNGEWVTLVNWTASPHITRGQRANRLKVSAFGPTISIYANDQLLATANDKTFSHGNFGFFAGTFSDPNLWVSFDDIRVWSPKGQQVAEIPTETPTPFRPAPTSIPTAAPPSPAVTAPPTGVEPATETPTGEGAVSPLPTPTTAPTATPEAPPDYILRNQPKPHGAVALSGRIAFPVYDPERGTYDIFIADADGGDGRILVAEKASQPDLSPDGDRIVFRSWDNERRGLILRDLVGSDYLVLTSAVEAGRPVFSPDGNVIIYHTREGADRKPAIFRFDGSQASVLRSPDNAPIGGQSPAWTPDGQRFVYATCVDGHCALYRSNIDGSGTIKISDDMSDNDPAISPDGNTVVFTSNRDGNRELYSVSIDGGPVTRLTEDPANDGIPTWAPDGNTIAFASDRDGEWAIWAMNPDGSDVRQLFPLGGPLEGTVQIDVENSPGWIEEHISWRP